MITFLIPTYNELSNIDRIVNKINQLPHNYKYNIFFIDDNSNDGSINVFKRLKKNNNFIDFHIRNASSRDLTQSILCSLELIQNKYVLILDCDMQHDIDSIPEMIKIIVNSDYNLVIGSRNISNIKILKRRYISFIGIWITKLIGVQKLIDPLSGFFIIETKLFKTVSPKIKTRGYKILLSIIFFLSKDDKIKEIKIKFFPRKYEKSKLNYKVIYLFVLQIIVLLKLRIMNSK